MELLKRNIHMDRVRAEAVTQITLEDDVNVSENKPDVSALNLEKAEVIIEEIKPGTDTVTVRGIWLMSSYTTLRKRGAAL